MARLMKHSLGQPDLGKFAGIHDRDSCRDLRHHQQTVRNEDLCQAELALQLLERQQNLRPHGNVQRRNGLVG